MGTLSLAGTAGDALTVPGTHTLYNGPLIHSSDGLGVLVNNFTFAQLVENTTLSGVSTVEVVIDWDGLASPSSSSEMGLCAIDSSRSGFSIIATTSTTKIREEVEGGAGDDIASVSHSYSGLITLKYEVDIATGDIEVFINGTSILTGTFTGSLSGLRGGIQQYLGVAPASVNRSLTVTVGGGGPTYLNNFKYWDGTAWVLKPLKYWDGTSWVEKLVRRWGGSSWIPALAGGGLLLASGIWGASGSADVVPDFTLTGYRWDVYGGGSSSVVSDALRLSWDTDPVDSGYYGPTLGLFMDDPGITLQDVYVEFEARFPSNVNGCKFVKFFGRRTETEGYSNATYNLLWSTGEFSDVLFTDGTDLEGDAARKLFFSGGNNSTNIGRAFGQAVVTTPQNSSFDETDWGNTWHTFKFRYKQNSGTTSGNEVADGVFYVEIDGNIYLSATNMFNRNPNNIQGLEKIEFGGWSQDGGGAFQLEFRNIKISSGGFV